MAKNKNSMTPTQSHRYARHLLEHSERVKQAQRQYKLAHNTAHKRSLDVEAKRLALEALQSQYVIESGTERDFEIYDKARRKLVRTESAYAKADEQFKNAQALYDKNKGPKNMKNLQLAREQIDKLKPKIVKDAAAFYRATDGISAIVNSTRAASQLDKALSAYSQAVEKYQKAIPKLQKASAELQSAWADHEKYLQSLRRKRLTF